MKKIISLLTIIILSNTLLNISTQAQTSPSPTPSEKIQGIREEVEKKVQEKLENIITEDQKKSWAGTINSVNENSFEITTNQQTRTITLDEETTIINQNRQTISFQDLEENQYILAMGYEKLDDTLNAKRIVITEAYETVNKTPIHGTIINKANGEKIVLVENQEKEYELILDNDTELNQKADNDINEIEYEDLKQDQQIVAVIQPADGETESYITKEILVLTPQQSSSPTETE